MPDVTYKNQPAIHKTKGKVPMEGNTHPYTVSKLLWPGDVENWIADHLRGTTLHICCGKSMLGDCRLDIYEPNADITGDAARLPFKDRSWDTLLIDPPYNGVFRWMHDMLSELSRVAERRIIFQHWYLPVNRQRQFKKAHRFELTEVAVWQPRTYFGRVNVLAVLDDDTGCAQYPEACPECSLSQCNAHPSNFLDRAVQTRYYNTAQSCATVDDVEGD